MSNNINSELTELLAAFDQSVAALERNPKSEALQCQCCLDSRSTFTEFYSVSEFRGELDKNVASSIKVLFQRALKVLPTGDYRSSVCKRFDEFKDFCRSLSLRKEEDTTVMT